jgi:transcriptional regulator with XRE-family HTH domain
VDDAGTRDTIRHNIRMLMKQHGVTQQELADAIGVTQPTVNTRLKGTGGPFEHHEVKRAAELMGESPERIYGPRLVLVAVPASDSVGPAGIEPATKGAKLLVRALGNNENPKAA